MNARDVSLVVVPVGHNLALLNVVGAVFNGLQGGIVGLHETRRYFAAPSNARKSRSCRRFRAL